MTEQEILELAGEIEATIDAGIAKTTGLMQSRIVELGQLLGQQAGEIAALREENKALLARIEQVAREPRVEIKPEFVVPVPAAHFAPTVQLPERRPRKTKTTKQTDGSFITEEVD